MPKLSCLIRRVKTANGGAEVHQDTQPGSQEDYRVRIKAEQDAALKYNIALFEEKVIPKVASNPKRFGIVVVTRYKWWHSQKERNEYYLEVARSMQYHYNQSKATVCFGYDNSIVAFMLPTKLNTQLKHDLREASEGYGAFKLSGIRFYSAKP